MTSIGVFASHTAAQQAVEELERAGLGKKRLSVVGEDHDSAKHPAAGSLHSLGFPKERITKYEGQLKAHNCLVIAHGSPQEVEKARAILQQNAAIETEIVNSPAPNIAHHVTIS